MGNDQTSIVRPLTLVAFGGNALQEPEDLGTVEEQRERARAAAEWLVRVIREGQDLVIVHGNGPQVGRVMIQMEEAATKVPPGTLDLAVAQTQGSMGYQLELAVRNRLRREGLDHPVMTFLSLVVVDREDPGFESPTKPVGPFFSPYRARILRRDHGWAMAEDAGRGWRKVVASPRPLEILGYGQIRELLGRGAVVIAAGGGGIPVIRNPGGELDGVEAVIDKDRTASLLGRMLRADQFVNLTGVPRVYKNFGTRWEKPLSRLTLRQARKLLEQGQFPPGSMGPKVESAVSFVEATGNRAVITDIEHVGEALAGEGGTEVVPDRRAAPAAGA